MSGGLFLSVDNYAAKDNGTASQVPASSTPRPGLLLAIFGAGSPATFAGYNVNVRVEKAVRVDGNNSILLAHYGTLLQGQHMIEAKVYYNRWGYLFTPG